MLDLIFNITPCLYCKSSNSTLHFEVPVESINMKRICKIKENRKHFD